MCLCDQSLSGGWSLSFSLSFFTSFGGGAFSFSFVWGDVLSLSLYIIIIYIYAISTISIYRYVSLVGWSVSLSLSVFPLWKVVCLSHWCVCV